MAAHRTQNLPAGLTARRTESMAKRAVELNRHGSVGVWAWSRRFRAERPTVALPLLGRASCPAQEKRKPLGDRGFPTKTGRLLSGVTGHSSEYTRALSSLFTGGLIPLVTGST